MEKDYYETLGVDKNASAEEIRRAYKKLAKKYHPDISKEKDAEEKLKSINEAYSVLSDPEKKQKYDTYGSEAFSNGARQGGFSGNYGFSNFSRGFNFDFSDIFSSFMDDDPFSSFSNFSRKSKKNKNLDLKEEITISFLEAAKGVKKEIEITRDEKCNECDGTGSKSMKKSVCPRCNGTGRVFSRKKTPFGLFSVQQVCPDCKGSGEVITDPCPYCDGLGYKKKKSKVSVNIPAGISNKDVIRLKDLGNVHRGYKGDLFVEVFVKPHKFYKRDRADLYLEIPVTYSDLILGTEIKIKGIQDNIKLKIPKYTDTGTIFKVKGKGLPNINRRGVHGDLYVKVFTDVPNKVSRKYKNLVSNLKDLDEKEIKSKIKKEYKDILKEN